MRGDESPASMPSLETETEDEAPEEVPQPDEAAADEPPPAKRRKSATVEEHIVRRVFVEGKMIRCEEIQRRYLKDVEVTGQEHE